MRSIRLRIMVMMILIIIANSGISALPARASFPGNNGRIVFYTNLDSGNYEIYSMNPDGSDRVNLTNDPAFDATPAWSADGTRIAFVRDFPGSLYVMNADGSNPTLVTSAVCIVGFPAWSPDGSKIAFTACGDDIWVVNVDGTGLTNLTNTTVFDRFPSWSPDGSRIAFSRIDAVTSRDDIWVMGADGSNPTDLTNNPAVQELQPDWSPDGSKIAYYSNEDIFVMNADGSGQTNLTMTISTVAEAQPSWAPDGTRIAFGACREDNTRCDIWTMAADGSDRVNLTSDIDGDVLNTWPDWQPIANPRDNLKLDVFWGPKDARTLAYHNIGNLTSGDYDVNPATGALTAISGTGTIPSAVSGVATVTFDIALNDATKKWSGTVIVDDPGAGFSATVPIHSWRFGVTRDGSTTRGVLWGFKAQSVPQKCFMFVFEIDDLG